MGDLRGIGKPKQEFMVEDTQYKIGRFGFVYYRSAFGDWVKSSISRSELRYDFKHGMHHHFLCKKCGRITDIDVECPNLGKMLECGHNVEEVHGYFKGICKKCMKKENDNGS